MIEFKVIKLDTYPNLHQNILKEQKPPIKYLDWRIQIKKKKNHQFESSKQEKY